MRQTPKSIARNNILNLIHAIIAFIIAFRLILNIGLFFKHTYKFLGDKEHLEWGVMRYLHEQEAYWRGV